MLWSLVIRNCFVLVDCHLFCLERGVNRMVWQVNEERFLTVLADKMRRLRLFTIGQVFSRRAILERLNLVRRKITWRLSTERTTSVDVEALTLRKKGRIAARRGQMPFTYSRRAIPERLEGFGDCALLKRKVFVQSGGFSFAQG